MIWLISFEKSLDRVGIFFIYAQNNVGYDLEINLRLCDAPSSSDRYPEFGRIQGFEGK